MSTIPKPSLVSSSETLNVKDLTPPPQHLSKLPEPTDAQIAKASAPGRGMTVDLQSCPQH